MAKAIVIYESTYGYTEMMAKSIEKGLKEAGMEVELKKVLSAKADELKAFDAIALGCPTYHHDMITTVKTFLFAMKNAGMEGKVGAAFGAYGFSGESVEMIHDTMKHIFEMDVVEPGLKLKTSEVMAIGDKECREFGKKIAAKIT